MKRVGRLGKNHHQHKRKQHEQEVRRECKSWSQGRRSSAEALHSVEKVFTHLDEGLLPLQDILAAGTLRHVKAMSMKGI